ncbi:MAG: hypothetical protein VX834_11950 [Myxococcota bacterium]|nr:hypothetical protein [Myxococcota bacterium]
MKTEEQFARDFEQAWPGKPYNRAWRLYEHQMHNQVDFMVMGNGSKVWEREFLVHYGLSADSTTEGVLDILSNYCRTYSIATAGELKDYFEERAAGRTDAANYEAWKAELFQKNLGWDSVQHQTVQLAGTAASKQYRNKNYEAQILDKLKLELKDELSGNPNRLDGFFDSGSVLAERNWEVHMNDTWLLSAVQRRATLYYATEEGAGTETKIGPEGVLYADNLSAFNLRVTGRELIGLHAFGYGPVSFDESDYAKLGRTMRFDPSKMFSAKFRPKADALVAASSLTEYRALMDKLAEVGSERAKIVEVASVMFPGVAH